MKSNAGKPDRNFRLVLGIIIAATGVYFKSWWGIVAIVPLAIGYCFSRVLPALQIVGD